MPVSTIVQSRPGPVRKRATSSSGRWVADRPIRWSGSLGQRLEALERQRQVGATLGLRDGVDLVDDHPLRVAQDLARPRGEHQVERLRRRDQHVGRLAEHRLARLLRRVAGADGDLDIAPDPLERRAQVALDVVGERLQRRDVDEARAAFALLRGLGDEPVEPVEEGSQRLARARGRREQDVVTLRNRRPGLGLRLGRRLEGAREPIAYGGCEGCEGGVRHVTRQRSARGQRPRKGGGG